MKKYITSLLIVSTFFFAGCNNKEPANILKFGTSAEYPPFEYYDHGEIKGFDIDLAKLVAKELGKEAVFENIQFSSILPALTGGQVDIGIATITITEERQQNFDFSEPYYTENFATLFKDEQPITDQSQLSGKKVACQFGSTMEIWLKANVLKAEIIAVDHNNQAVEMLKAGNADVVLVNGVQGAIFSKENPGLSYAVIAESGDGYGMAFSKGSPLKDKVNLALKALRARGEIKKLQEKWVENIEWKN